jgi:iron(III) transport system permease protein
VGWPLTTRRVILSAALLVLTILGLAPIIVMFASSLIGDGAFSLQNYRGLFAASRSWHLLSNSLALALATALISTLAGLPLGLLFAKTDLPLRRVFALHAAAGDSAVHHSRVMGGRAKPTRIGVELFR